MFLTPQRVKAPRALSLPPSQSRPPTAPLLFCCPGNRQAGWNKSPKITPTSRRSHNNFRSNNSFSNNNNFSSRNRSRASNRRAR